MHPIRAAIVSVVCIGAGACGAATAEAVGSTTPVEADRPAAATQHADPALAPPPTPTEAATPVPGGESAPPRNDSQAEPIRGEAAPLDELRQDVANDLPVELDVSTSGATLILDVASIDDDVTRIDLDWGDGTVETHGPGYATVGTRFLHLYPLDDELLNEPEPTIDVSATLRVSSPAGVAELVIAEALRPIAETTLNGLYLSHHGPHCGSQPLEYDDPTQGVWFRISLAPVRPQAGSADGIRVMAPYLHHRGAEVLEKQVVFASELGDRPQLLIQIDTVINGETMHTEHISQDRRWGDHRIDHVVYPSDNCMAEVAATFTTLAR